MPSNSQQGRQLSDCLSGKSTRRVPGGIFQGFWSQEIGGYVMMQGLDRFGPLGKRNTLRYVGWYTTVTSPSTHATAWASFFGDVNVRFFLKKIMRMNNRLILLFSSYYTR